MVLARVEFSVTDESGNVMPAASVSVRRESDNGAPSLYSDPDGSVAIGNPFTADADGLAAFHVVGGIYKITATRGLTTRVNRYHRVGTVQSADLDTDAALAANSDVRVASQKAVKAYVDAAAAVADAMVFKGVIDCSGTPNYPAADRGWTYRVSVAGKIGGASGTNVEAGDVLICLTDGTLAGTQAGVGASWTIAQANIDGAVVGPSSAIADDFAQFNGATGKLIKGGIGLDTNTALGTSDVKVPSQKAVKTYADALIAANDAMVFRGVTDCSANPNYPAADRGHTYRVSVAGKIGGASGVAVEAGDIFICLTDSTASGTQAGVGASWTVVQTNIDGAVIGPASATDSHFAQFDGATGKLLKGGIALDTDVALAANSDTNMASQKAVKAYIDALGTAAAFVAFSPSAVPTGGAGATFTVNTARYKRVGKVVTAYYRITLTTLGSASGRLKVDLPAQAFGTCLAAVAGFNSTQSKGINGIVNYDSATTLSVYLYDGSFPGAGGDLLFLTAVYEAL